MAGLMDCQGGPMKAERKRKVKSMQLPTRNSKHNLTSSLHMPAKQCPRHHTSILRMLLWYYSIAWQRWQQTRHS